MKTSQRTLALEYLKLRSGRFIPAWEFVGEKFIPSLGWVLMSYKVPARLSDLYNQGLVDRELVKGRLGTSYYAYKLREKKII
jgi:hypothetical protein